MGKFTLMRTGDMPAQFEGEILARSTRRPSDKIIAKEKFIRYHDVALYKTKTGKYVVSINYISTSKGEDNNSLVIICENSSQVAEELLDSYDPVDKEHFVGFPAGTLNFEDKQANLRTQLERQWDAQVSEVLSQAGFVETIE